MFCCWVCVKDRSGILLRNASGVKDIADSLTLVVTPQFNKLKMIEDLERVQIKKQNSGTQAKRTDRVFCLPHKKQNSGTRAKRTDRVFCLPHKKQNSGNQPEFQSSIKKRTVLKLLLRYGHTDRSRSVNLNTFSRFYFLKYVLICGLLFL